jgi:copper chaperone CopZ
MCNNAINKALKALPFVGTVKSDIKNASFDIQFKDGSPLDIDAIKAAVEDAGFFVAKLQLTGTFDNVNVKGDEHVVIGDKTFHFLEVNDQVLNGEKTFTIVDKNFLTNKEFKKVSHATKMACLQTGKAADCCIKDGIAQNTRIYHVTI